jgi:uncharacterized cupin superfamily protein
MKEIEVFNYNDMEGEQICSGESGFTYKSVIAPTSPYAAQCHIAFVEIPPGKQSFNYHYHETDEEAFYIISGEGVVRTPKGDIAVKAGDVITFPAGPEHAHSIRNPSPTEKLVYIDFDTHNLPEITHYPDTGRVEVLGPHSAMSYDSRTGTPSKNPRKKSGVRQ